ncbi:hypothetical protein [Streptomyces venezuelae]|uniref:hypothetical protein n=1 Tax=Streptomyces venezuelae TaxID=54571 RepID=UPI00365A9EC6
MSPRIPVNRKKIGVAVLTAAGCLAAVGVVAVAAPAFKDSALMPDAVSEHVFKEKTKSFPTAADAPTPGSGSGSGSGPESESESGAEKGDRAFVLPAWISEDAKNVKVKVKTDGAAKLVRFTVTGAGAGAGAGSGSGVGSWSGLGRGQGCGGEGEGAGAARGPVGEPRLDASWWPDRTPRDARAECGDRYRYRVAVQGDTAYAWTNGELSSGGR